MLCCKWWKAQHITRQFHYSQEVNNAHLIVSENNFLLCDEYVPLLKRVTFMAQWKITAGFQFLCKCSVVHLSWSPRIACLHTVSVTYLTERDLYWNWVWWVNWAEYVTITLQPMCFIEWEHMKLYSIPCRNCDPQEESIINSKEIILTAGITALLG